MGVPVKKLELTRLDDGRQCLRIEVEDGPGTVMTWYGYLEVETEEPVARKPMTLDLTLAAVPGEHGDPWGRIEVKPPYDFYGDFLVKYP